MHQKGPAKLKRRQSDRIDNVKVGNTNFACVCLFVSKVQNLF